MLNKEKIRKKFLKIRKNNYYEVNKKFFEPLITFLNKKFKNKKFNLSFYYPTNYEVNTLKLIELLSNKKNITTLLPLTNSNKMMSFTKWSFLDILKVNKFGILEPIKIKKNLVPHVSLVPLLAYDKRKFRLGYGKGYYDKYFNKYLKLNKNITTIGVAFSFQKYHKLPTSNFDVKLDYILTEKGI
ncbi:MAG: 5-formyltetrahydrofolate cyclo-ligase [Pelagibacterales bacterium MED-G40]|nr:MAG: 5-formyltetrahydrofolate cyclo-ligase [Pelagibacterales bacterium MED-G40]|tara:strand:+ start:7219 stop:7773 length:555 start_codon:yes stop_codon:yes gene_type:complete